MICSKWRVVGLCLLLSSALVAQTHLDLAADSIVLDQKKGQIHSSGNVKMHYRGQRIHTEELLYDNKKREISIPTPYIVTSNQGTSISGESFFYNFKKYRGRTSTFNAKIKRLNMKGREIKIAPERIVIIDGEFTTCDRETLEHYKIRSKRIYLYPQFGFFVAVKNSVDVGFLPFSVPVPTYVYGSKRYSLIASSTLFPEIGTSEIEGFYIKGRFGYFLNRKSSGTIDVGTASKLGLIYGFTHSHSLTDDHQVAMSLHKEGSDGMTGRGTYHIDFFNERPQQSTRTFIETLANTFSPIGQLPPTRVSVIYQHREILNNRRVNYKPQVEVLTNRLAIPKTQVVASTKTTAGYVSEEYKGDKSEQIFRTTLHSKLTRGYKLSRHTGGTFSSLYYGNFYKSRKNWQRAFANVSYQLDFKRFYTEVSYSKRLMRTVGEPVFDFEGLYSQEADEIGHIFRVPFNNMRFSTELNYNLENHTVRNFDLISQFTLHCWRLNLRWKTQQSAIRFGVDIY